MADEKEKAPETIDVKGLGKVTKTREGMFKMSNSEAQEFFKEHGIPDYNEVMKALSSAKGELVCNAVDNLLLDETLKTKADSVLKVGTGDGRIDITLQNKVTRRNIQTKESYDVYGNVKVSEKWTPPFRPNDKNGKFAELSAKIEKNNLKK